MSNALEPRVRAALNELADGGRPVDLADVALRGAARRRTRLVLVVSAVAAVMALATLTVGGSLIGRDRARRRHRPVRGLQLPRRR